MAGEMGFGILIAAALGISFVLVALGFGAGAARLASGYSASITANAMMAGNYVAGLARSEGIGYSGG